MARPLYQPGDHGDAKKAAKRERPVSTTRAIDPASTAAERARGSQGRVQTIPHVFAPDGTSSAETAAETKRRRDAERKRKARADAKAAKAKAG